MHPIFKVSSSLSAWSDNSALFYFCLSLLASGICLQVVAILPLLSWGIKQLRRLSLKQVVHTQQIKQSSRTQKTTTQIQKEYERAVIAMAKARVRGKEQASNDLASRNNSRQPETLGKEKGQAPNAQEEHRDPRSAYEQMRKKFQNTRCVGIGYTVQARWEWVRTSHLKLNTNG
jgi:hypothetical protein